jgi:hypothetical protein
MVEAVPLRGQVLNIRLLVRAYKHLSFEVTDQHYSEYRVEHYHDHRNVQNVWNSEQKTSDGHFEAFVLPYQPQRPQDPKGLNNFEALCPRCKAEVGEGQNYEIQGIPEIFKVAIRSIHDETICEYLHQAFSRKNDNRHRIDPEDDSFFS